MNGRNIVFQGNVGNLISTNIRWGSDLSYVSIYIIIRAISFDKNNNPYLKVHVQHYIMCSDFLQDKRYFIDQFGPTLTKKTIWDIYVKLYVKYRGHLIVKYMSHICILNVNEVEDI